MCCIVIEARVGPCLRLCPPFPALSIRRITGCLRILVQFLSIPGVYDLTKVFGHQVLYMLLLSRILCSNS